MNSRRRIFPPILKSPESAADRALKAKLYRSELEAQVQEKLEAEQKRRETEIAEDEKLMKRIHTQRENERKAYLQEIKAIEKSKLEETRARQQEITRRLEEIQIEEARQRDEEAVKQRQILLDLIYRQDFGQPRPNLSHHQRPWHYWSGNELESWIRSWQLTLEEIYLRAPLHELVDLSRKLDIEQEKLHRIMKDRLRQFN